MYEQRYADDKPPCNVTRVQLGCFICLETSVGSGNRLRSINLSVKIHSIYLPRSHLIEAVAKLFILFAVE